jgi:uncharacterized protein
MMAERDIHLMILPSLACQAHCSYCFGPNRGERMATAMFDATLEWIETILPAGDAVDITFHGGEPLLVGIDWYKYALPRLRQSFGNRLKLGIQSNLWLLDDKFCELLSEYTVNLGTSLDGPQEINDAQRGQGYYQRTMLGIETARRHGLSVGAICTFTHLSAPKAEQIFNFFAAQSLPFSIHGAVCTLDIFQENKSALAPDEYADLFIRLFDLYLENIHRMRISTFDQMARGISAGAGGLCTFSPCLGRYLAVGAEGAIYPCNRFAHLPQWQMGNVQDNPSLNQIGQSTVWKLLKEREEGVKEDCSGCPYLTSCQGGCAYNAVSREGFDRRDGLCLAYQRIFHHITDRALEQVFSKENMQAVVAGGREQRGLMQKGTLLQIMRGDAHPQKLAGQARQIAASVALADSHNPNEALGKLQVAGLISHPERALGSLENLWQRLHILPDSLLNAYLHVTYTCNLACKHCYAQAGPGRMEAMPVDEMIQIVKQLAAAGFQKIVLTGGEPLMHPQAGDLFNQLGHAKGAIRPAKIVLRTNLAYDLTPQRLTALKHGVHQVVISLDGNPESHAARRGDGNYAITETNLRKLVSARIVTDIGLTAVLTSTQIQGDEGQHLRALAQELGIELRFKPVLPLGRATGMPLALEHDSSLVDSIDAVTYQHGPIASCGLGMNLYVAPDGDCFPCYALMAPRHRLGNLFQEDCHTILERNSFYLKVNVDSNRGCSICFWRYLCGGFCRAWSHSDDPDEALPECAALRQRSAHSLLAALEVLEILPERWQSAGLPLS